MEYRPDRAFISHHRFGSYFLGPLVRRAMKTTSILINENGIVMALDASRGKVKSPRMTTTYIRINSEGVVEGTTLEKPHDEIGYFIEQGTPHGGTGLWLNRLDGNFTRDPDKAKKFKRRYDAEMFRRGYGGLERCFVSEHIFMVSEEALTRFNASYREFEDQRIVQGYLPDSAFTRTDTDESALIPNTELELAVEVEEVPFLEGDPQEHTSYPPYEKRLRLL